MATTEDAYGTLPAAPQPATSSQTIGPYWHLLADPALADLTRFGATGERMVLTGRVTDGEGAPVTDACVEIWQANPDNDAVFDGWGRSATDSDGCYRFITLRPGPVPSRGNTMQAPHFAVSIFARGLLHQVVTRAYFADHPLNDTDPLLNLVEDDQRRASLISTPVDGKPDVWVFNICMQGEHETVFLDI